MVTLRWFNNSILCCFSSNFPSSKTEDECYTYFNCPDDVLIEILSRVPIDSLKVFKRVCHHWRVLISSYGFLKLHLKRAKEEAINEPLLFTEYTQYTSISESSRQAFWFGVDGRSEDNLPNLDGIRKRCYDIVGSCDGFFMFHSQSSQRSLIINPITQESRIITNPYEKGSPCCIFFDRFEDDYKLLHVFPDRTNILPYDFIYSFKRGVWTRLKSVQTHHRFLPRLDDPPVVICDALHWTGYSNYRCSKMVLVFKVETKDFMYMPYPSAMNTKLYEETNCCLLRDSDNRPHEESMGVFEKDGLLCLCHKVHPSKAIDIWFLQSYGNWGAWERMFTIDLLVFNMYSHPYGEGSCGTNGECMRCMESIKIVKLKHDDILIDWPCRGLFLYNLETTWIRKIEDFKMRNTPFVSRGPHNCIPLIKTLLSPNNVYSTL